MYLIAAEARERIDAAIAGGFDLTRRPPEAAVYDSDAVRGGVATIVIEGILSRDPDPMAWLFGESSTTYASIARAFAAADADPRVQRIEMRVHSYGGTVDGLYDAILAMNGTEKHITAVVWDVAASAAYALVSQADEIVATSPMSRVGSIGVAVDAYVSSSRVSIASTEAPEKRPDLRTEDGQAVVRRELDAMHSEFVRAVADGRGVDPATVNREFGRGSLVLAADAKRRGMIDAIASDGVTAGAFPDAVAQEKQEMKTIEDLRAQHPDLYAAAVGLGVAQERDRCSAHIRLARESGAVEVALKAIEDGSDITAGVTASHQAAAIAQIVRGARTADALPATGAPAAPTADRNAAIRALLEGQV